MGEISILTTVKSFKNILKIGLTGLSGLTGLTELMRQRPDLKKNETFQQQNLKGETITESDRTQS